MGSEIKRLERDVAETSERIARMQERLANPKSGDGEDYFHYLRRRIQELRVDCDDAKKELDHFRNVVATKGPLVPMEDKDGKAICWNCRQAYERYTNGQVFCTTDCANEGHQRYREQASEPGYIVPREIRISQLANRFG